MSLKPDSILNIQLATVLSGLESLGWTGREDLRQTIPSGVKRLLEGLGSDEPGIKTEIDIVRTVLQVARFGECLDGLNLPPSIRAAFERVDHNQDSDHCRQATLLCLASTLEESGNWGAAAQTYLKASHGRCCRINAQAFLALARLALHNGHFTRTAEYCTASLQAAEQFGATLAGRVSLEAGLLLRNDGARARPYFLRAAEAFRELGLPGPLALSELARFSFCERSPSGFRSCLKTLLEPRHRPEFRRSASWLLPVLLQDENTIEDAVASTAALRFCKENRELSQDLIERDELGMRVKLWLKNQFPPSSAAVPLPTLKIYSLGGFDIVCGQERVSPKAFTSQKIRFLLAMLVAAPRRQFPVDKLIEEFWPTDPVRGRNSLNQAISLIRRLLRPAGWRGEMNCLQRTAEAIYFEPYGIFWHDLLEIEEAIERIGQLQQLDQKKEALELLPLLRQHYRGPYLEGCYLEWANVRRMTLEEKLLRVLRWLVTSALESEQFERSLDGARLLLEIDRCSQEGHLAAIVSLSKLGRPEAAIRQYEHCRLVLSQELGIEPGPQIQKALLLP